MKRLSADRPWYPSFVKSICRGGLAESSGVGLVCGAATAIVARQHTTAQNARIRQARRPQLRPRQPRKFVAHAVQSDVVFARDEELFDRLHSRKYIAGFILQVSAGVRRLSHSGARFSN